MAEAEDVILHTAERASATAAALWRRRPTEEAPASPWPMSAAGLAS
jgi:hypothetical protein